MKKLFLCASLVVMGMLTACEKELLVPEGTKPEWLGESIYEELRSGTHLKGTFNTYLKLVDDLEYDEVLARTGSKTVFPANDEAFERFFQNGANPYGATCYEELTDAMKKQILYSSMLDNALLAGMLSNVMLDANNVSRGRAIKHETSASVIDTITFIGSRDGMPQNNAHWRGFDQIHVVSDATRPMMVHFTREQMLANNITTTGTDSDFGILRGEQVGSSIANSDTAYIYQTQIVKQDVTCINGYIHQVADVLVPPGNIAQVLRNEPNTKLVSRVIDYHSAPYYDATTTRNYNSWAMEYGMPIIDSIFQVRYFSSRSQGGSPNLLAPSGMAIPTTGRLEWDLGWNQYYSSTDAANSLDDMGAILVPTDDAVEEYFLPGGEGDFFIELYGADGLDNTKENLPANLDALYNKGNGILTTFVNNMIQTSFVATVPSKFNSITNDGSGDFMGLTKNDIQVTNGKYDVKVANNGVIYKMKKLYAPDEFRSVIGPAIIYPELSIMGYFSQDKTSGANAAVFGADMYYYLMAMKSNYIYFVPSNEALKNCFIDPVSLGTTTPRAMEFYTYVDSTGRAPKTMYGAKLHPFNRATGEINLDSVYETILDVAKLETGAKKSTYASQISDMLNYNTVVLDEGEQLINNYYLTKHGGAVKITDLVATGNDEYTGYVWGGAQIDNNMAPAKIVRGWEQANGWTFQLDNLVQPCITSISQVLNGADDRFQAFLDLCKTFENVGLMAWAGISSTAVEEGQTPPIERYIVFSGRNGKALDNNVSFLNGYNYTIYAPDNKAMQIAHEQMGLPTYEQIYAVYEEATSEDATSEAEAQGKAKARKMIDAVRGFVRYHFQNNSVFADNFVKETSYQSLYSSDLGIPVNITTKSTGGMLTVTDAAEQSIVIDANDTERIVNKMARDYEFDQDKKTATSIAVSSFAVIHQVSTPLCYSKSKRYDDTWAK
ncbi:MAG: fasciclin domain-containing protein [Bacteroidaceae bacterium]|nr:fasciclin domain-containing protein [Bacteroidaceae bacterium]